jgi:hypothetical protein
VGDVLASAVRRRGVVGTTAAIASSAAALTLLPCSAMAATRQAHYTGGEGTASSPLDIAEAHASYDDAGALTLVMRFAQPAADPLPSGTTLRWTVSTKRDPAAQACPASKAGDVGASLVASPTTSTASYRQLGRVDGSGKTIVRPLSLSFSPDRLTATATISDTGIADQDFRCIEATTDVPGVADSFDTTDHVPFLLPLDRLAVRRGLHRQTTSKRPGYTILSIRATHGAKISLKVRRRGRVVYARALTGREGGAFRKRFNWSCRKPGSYRFTVRATDAYGKSITRRGSWTVSRRRCASLEAAERRAAERRAAERRAARERERARREESSSGCAPGYSPCLPIVGDLDCDEIDDGIKPVTVFGDDQYDLDRDGDGSGCDT